MTRQWSVEKQIYIHPYNSIFYSTGYGKKRGKNNKKTTETETRNDKKASNDRYPPLAQNAIWQKSRLNQSIWDGHDYIWLNSFTAETISTGWWAGVWRSKIPSLDAHYAFGLFFMSLMSDSIISFTSSCMVRESSRKIFKSEHNH